MREAVELLPTPPQDCQRTNESLATIARRNSAAPWAAHHAVRQGPDSPAWAGSRRTAIPTRGSRPHHRDVTCQASPEGAQSLWGGAAAAASSAFRSGSHAWHAAPCVAPFHHPAGRQHVLGRCAVTTSVEPACVRVPMLGARGEAHGVPATQKRATTCPTTTCCREQPGRLYFFLAEMQVCSPFTCPARPRTTLHRCMPLRTRHKALLRTERQQLTAWSSTAELQCR